MLGSVAATASPDPKRERFWQKRSMKLLLAALALLLVAGCATGLAVGLTRSSSGSSGASLNSLERELPCCVPLGANMQLRYAKPSEASVTLDFALVGALAEQSWMSWGPADPRATNRLMVGLAASAASSRAF